MAVMVILIVVNIVIVVGVMWLGSKEDAVKHLTPLPEYAEEEAVPVAPVAAPVAERPAPPPVVVTPTPAAHAVTQEVLEKALEKLQSNDASERRASIERLAGAQHVEAVPRIVNALRDPDVLVRLSAASGLDTLGWAPENSAQNAAYLIARQDWEAVTKAGSSANGLLEIRLHDDGIAKNGERIGAIAARLLSEMTPG